MACQNWEDLAAWQMSHLLADHSCYLSRGCRLILPSYTSPSVPHNHQFLKTLQQKKLSNTVKMDIIRTTEWWQLNNTAHHKYFMEVGLSMEIEKQGHYLGETRQYTCDGKEFSMKFDQKSAWRFECTFCFYLLYLCFSLCFPVILFCTAPFWPPAKLHT